MHIEFTLPPLDRNNTYSMHSRLVARNLVTSRMTSWGEQYPNAHYTLAVTDTHVQVRFDNAEDTTLWAMTWDQHKGRYHATSWKRIKIHVHRV